MHIALVGNLSGGYRAFGPFSDFDAAAVWADGPDHGVGKESWIMELEDPEEEKRRVAALDELEAFAKKLGVTEEALDEEVHEAKGDEAAGIDNSGMRGQLAYLLDGRGDLSHRVKALKLRLEALAK